MHTALNSLARARPKPAESAIAYQKHMPEIHAGPVPRFARLPWPSCSRPSRMTRGRAHGDGDVTKAPRGGP